MNKHELKKLEINKLKEKLIDYFKSSKGFDATISQLYEFFQPIKLELLEYCLGELVEQDWIKKSKSLDHYEYDPGKKLDYCGLEE